MRFRQGSTYELPVRLKDKTGTVIGADGVSKVEFMFGPVRKLYPNDVTFDTDHFVVTLSQQDTFLLEDKGAPVQIRVLFNGGTVDTSDVTWEAVLKSISREVLA